MPGQHALLSPSAAERWIACPASIRLTRKVGRDSSSVYAEEGTAAHALAEIKARLAFGQITERQFTRARARWARDFAQWADDPDVVLEMELHTDAYVALIKERAELFPNTSVRFEQRLNTGVPNSWGTSDTVLVSPLHVEIVDFKYGAGVAVEAVGNPQLRLYGVGALDEFGDLLGETELIRMTVHQPRLDHVLTEELTPEELRTWRAEVVIPRAELAVGPDAPFGPSDEACRWCPASGRCAAQVEAAFPDDLDETDPELLSPDQLANLLERLPTIKVAIAAVEASALADIYSNGVAVPRWKVVKSGGKRSVKDHAAGMEVLAEQGYDQDDYAETKLRGIGALEKLLGKPLFAELLEKPGIVAKGDGSPSLVPESDPRPSITPNAEAAKEFDE